MKVKNLVCLALILLFPKIIFSQIVNKGTLHIKESTEVFFENEYVNQSTGRHINNGDLYLNSNFVNNGNTESYSGTTFFKSSENTILNINGTANIIFFWNLEIDVNGLPESVLPMA